MTRPDRENIPRTLALALALWTVFAGSLALSTAADQLSPALLRALCAFAFGFALASCFLDAAVRESIDGARVSRLLIAALVLGAALYGVPSRVLATVLLAPLEALLLVVTARRLMLTRRPAASSLRAARASGTS